MDINHFIGLDYRARISNYFSAHPRRCSWGPRRIMDHEFILQVKGTGRYEGADGSLTILENELVLIAPDVEHTYSCSPETDPAISCIHFSAPGIPVCPARRFDCREDYRIPELFRKCAEEFSHQGPHYQQVMTSIMAEIWIRLHRLELRTGRREPVRIRQAKEFIQNHYTGPVSRSMIAESAGITPEHLNLLFKKHCDSTPMGFLTRVRIHKAKTLLSSGYNVSQTAYSVGYEDPLYFSRVFKKLTGIPPSRYGGV